MREHRILTALRRCGRKVSLERDGMVYSFTACILPLMHRNRQYLDERFARTGHGDPNLFQYYGAAQGGGELLRAGDVLTDGGERFYVSVCEMVRCGYCAAYVWGLLRRAALDEGGGES